MRLILSYLFAFPKFILKHNLYIFAGAVMPFLQLVILALIQGLTEFLPVSSSGHLIVAPKLIGWQDQGLALDVASHIGTLCAVLIYFRQDIGRMAMGSARLASGKLDEGARLTLFIACASLPAVLFGAVIKTLGWDELFRSAFLVGVMMIAFGIVLYLADRFGAERRVMADIGLGQAMMIGLAQMLALIPGTSRSGITITAGRALGFNRSEAARFSMLLGVPAMLGAGAIAAKDLVEQGDPGMMMDALWLGALSFLFGLAAIWILMTWVRRSRLTPFVIYRLIFGAILILGALYWDL